MHYFTFISLEFYLLFCQSHSGLWEPSAVKLCFYYYRCFINISGLCHLGIHPFCRWFMNMLNSLAFSRNLCYLWSLHGCCLSTGTTLEASWIRRCIYFCIVHFWRLNQFNLYISVPWQITFIRSFTDRCDQKPYGNPARLYQACISCPYAPWLFPRTLVARELWFSSRNMVLTLPPYVLFLHVSLNFPYHFTQFSCSGNLRFWSVFL